MNRHTLLLWGTSCLALSGLLYTLERIAANTLWAAQVQTGTFPTYPPNFMDMLSHNGFISLFGLAGILFYMKAFRAGETDDSSTHSPHTMNRM